MGLSPRQPLDPLHCHPSPVTSPQNYPKPQSSIFLHLHGSSPHSVMDAAAWGWHHSPQESPQGKARPFPRGYRVAVGTLVLAQCRRGWWGCSGSPRESPLPLPAPGGHNGSGSSICLRAEFVLKRFIIFLTGRFPVSVLVNNCSQLNLCKIHIVGTGMRETQHARISHKPTGGSCCRRGAP